MLILQNLFIRLFARHVGTDEFGNRYFVSRFQDMHGSYKRQVIYKGIPEPSKIPPMWHAWIHYCLNEIPVFHNYQWQKKHVQNLTGSKYAYKPKNLKQPGQINENKIYESWKPKEEV
jgi:NADH:ubiquinone oxidoreductase subunit